VLVTHNIEEAIILADRIVILSANPGRIRGEIRVTLARPRQRNSKDFRAMADHVYTLMTNPDTKIAPLRTETPKTIDQVPLPHARPGAISGLLELIEEYGGPQDVAIISERLRMEADDLLPILDAAVQLGFAEVREGDATLTDAGRKFADADPEEMRHIFRDAVLQHAPMVTSIYQAILANRGRPMKEEFFLDVLDESFSAEEAQTQFDTAVNWGQYARLFEYDSDDKEIHLPVEATEEPI
jgi:NitT/TauT family transport system ATP-binding protein